MSGRRLGYIRRWLTNFEVTDNLSQAPSDFGTFSVVAPSDPRLPGGGGYTISNLYNVNQNVASAVNQVQTLASAYGNYTQVFNGLLVNVTARPRNGLVFQGGVSTGNTRTNYCDIRSALPEQNILGAQSPTNPWCNTATGLLVTRALTQDSAALTRSRRSTCCSPGRSGATRALRSPRTGRLRTRSSSRRSVAR